MIVSILIGVVSFILFCWNQTRYIWAGDAGDLLTAAYTFGVAHPPGYPLYTFLGYLISHIPISTIAFRITLLSSLPHAIVLALVYFLAYRLTKNMLASIAGCILLLGNYIFFLYSVTPEVFALLDLSLIALLVLLYEWRIYHRSAFLYIASFVFGLSLGHHHMILFAVPGFLYWVYPVQKRIFRYSNVFTVVACFLVGISVYAYVPIAAQGRSIINWDSATTLSNFVRLITRADYGSFQSGVILGQLPIQRFLQIKALVQYTVFDFSWIGVCCILFGIYAIYKRSRQLGNFYLSLFFCLGPFFFFYASFPLASRFSMGTYERFLLPTYVLFSLFFSVGLAAISHRLSVMVSSKTHSRAVVGGGIALVFCLVFVYRGLSLLQRFSGISHDTTAQQLGMDMLNPLPQQSVLLLNRDTVLFTTQYVRYVLGVRPDVYLLHTNKLGDPLYTRQLSRIFPDLVYPTGSSESFIRQFLEDNASKRRLFSNSKITPPPHWFWVPYGLVYELVSESSLPTVLAMKNQNDMLWSQMHTPEEGILRTYEHLLLSDIRNMYMDQRFEYGNVLRKAGDMQGAIEQYNASIAYKGDVKRSDIYIQKGLTELFMKQCDTALHDFSLARKEALSEDKNLRAYEAMVYKECLNDQKRAREFFSEHERELQGNDILLQSL